MNVENKHDFKCLPPVNTKQFVPIHLCIINNSNRTLQNGTVSFHFDK